MRITDHCKEKTNFVCRYGTYQFEGIPFGLMKAPATLQRMTDVVWKGQNFSMVYVGDVIKISENLEERVDHCFQVFDQTAFYELKI